MDPGILFVHNSSMDESRSSRVSWVDIGADESVLVGFTSRHGGASGGDFASLNLGFHVADDPDDVASNRETLQLELDSDIVWMSQIHGATIRNAADSTLGSRGYLSVGEADAIVVDKPSRGEHVAAAVMVADCIPLVIADPVRTRGAVVHVGRAGLELRIAQKAVAELVRTGSRCEDLLAVMGPSICGRCYEIPAAMVESVATENPRARSETRWGTPALDLPEALEAQLEGVHVRRILRSSACTFENENYFSHRRASNAGKHTGRFAGILRLQG